MPDLNPEDLVKLANKMWRTGKFISENERRRVGEDIFNAEIVENPSRPSKPSRPIDNPEGKV